MNKVNFGFQLAQVRASYFQKIHIHHVGTIVWTKNLSFDVFCLWKIMCNQNHKITLRFHEVKCFSFGFFAFNKVFCSAFCLAHSLRRQLYNVIILFIASFFFFCFFVEKLNSFRCYVGAAGEPFNAKVSCNKKRSVTSTTLFYFVVFVKVCAPRTRPYCDEMGPRIQSTSEQNRASESQSEQNAKYPLNT